MGHRDAGHQRNTVAEQGFAGAPGQVVYQRDKQNKRHFKKYWNRHDQADSAKSPRRLRFAPHPQQGVGDALGAAGDLQYFTNHGAQANNNGDVTEGAAHAFLDQRRHFR